MAKCCEQNGNVQKSTCQIYTLVAIFVTVILGLKSVNGFCYQDKSCDVCITPVCVSASNRMISYMDSSIDPCQDFYQYACGRWSQTNPIPVANMGNNLFSRMEQDFKLTMRNIFEQPKTPEILKSEAKKGAHHFYQSCVNVSQREELDGLPLLKLLDHIGGWPVNKIPPNWNFQQVLETSHNILHTGGFFKWTIEDLVEEELPNPIILLLPSMDKKFVSRLPNFAFGIEQVIKLLNISISNPQQIVDDIAEVDMALSSIASQDNLKETNIFELTSIGEFQIKVPFLNWNPYFQSAFSQVDKLITSSNHIAWRPMFFTELDKFISTTLSANDIGPRKLHNYLGWQVITSYLPHLSQKFRDVCYLVRAEGCDDVKETWEFCVGDTNKAMSFAVGAMFVHEEFNSESKPLIESILTAVKEAFEKNFDRLEWMDNETRQVVKDKAEAVFVKTGYPEFILNQTLLDGFYNNIQVNPNEYFKNKFRSIQFSARKNWMELNKPFDKTLWREVKLIPVNAYYTPNLNQIHLTVGALKNPYFDISFPHSLNFGAMGFIMGHELTHGFDNNGRRFDRNGKFRQWWNNATIERFNRQTECLIEQYSSYHFKGQHINGVKTLGENMADNGGLKAAFNALVDWIVNQNEDVFVLPGLYLSHKQLFFLSFAQVFCSSSKDEQVLSAILSDPHSIDRYRVIGTLSNMAEFATEFQCPLGSPMNPTIKCQVW